MQPSAAVVGAPRESEDRQFSRAGSNTEEKEEAHNPDASEGGSESDEFVRASVASVENNSSARPAVATFNAAKGSISSTQRATHAEAIRLNTR